MENNRTQDDWDDDNEGHVDTCRFNHACENPDTNLWCDLALMLPDRKGELIRDRNGDNACTARLLFKQRYSRISGHVQDLM